MLEHAEIPDLSGPAEKCSGCPIRHRAVCSYSSTSELTHLDAIKFYRDYDAGEEIVGEGEPVKALGSIVSGVVALHKTLEDGRRQMVGLLFPSDFIGRPLREFAPYEAIAISPVKMCLFHRSKFEKVLLGSLSLERRLLEMMLDELDAAREWMVLLGRKTARERVASFIMILARRQAMLERRPLARGLSLDLPLSREAIAEYLGLTIETVSRQLTQMRKSGLIDIAGRKTISLLDIDVLTELSGIETTADGMQAVG